MSRTLVLGDVHGGHRALTQVFERAKVDYAEDTIIFLGDVADGWPDTKECIDELLKLDNLIALWGNHDWWTWEWVRGAWYRPEPLWTAQGGQATLDSYGGKLECVPQSHVDYFKSLKAFWEDDEGRIYVHGGWPDANRGIGPMPFTLETMMWDRSLWQSAIMYQASGEKSFTQYNEVYIGHTSTMSTTRTGVPTKRCEVWNMDTGGGWEGKLSIMDVDTKDFWQSDRVADLYPEVQGR